MSDRKNIRSARRWLVSGLACTLFGLALSVLEFNVKSDHGGLWGGNLVFGPFITILGLSTLGLLALGWLMAQVQDRGGPTLRRFGGWRVAIACGVTCGIIGAAMLTIGLVAGKEQYSFASAGYVRVADYGLFTWGASLAAAGLILITGGILFRSPPRA